MKRPVSDGATLYACGNGAQESLRLYPPVPLTIREAVVDTTITTSAGKEIPLAKGTLMVVLPFVMQRLEKYWGPDADAFRPERFLHKDAAGNTPGSSYSFLPFIAGARSCIGSRFAVLEMKVRVVVVVVMCGCVWSCVRMVGHVV